MAILCRCGKHAPTRVIVNEYTHYAKPLGYPNSSSICGSVNCLNNGLIYMDNAAVNAFNTGQRIFKFATHVTKVIISDDQPIARE